MHRFLNQLMPFILAVIAIIAFAFGIMLLAYLFLFAALIGISIYIVNWIKNIFLPKKPKPLKTKSGRIIDSNDFKDIT